MWGINEFFSQVYWPSKRIREGTAKDYMRIFKNHVAAKFGGLRLSDVSDEEWSLFLTGLVNDGMSPARANRVRTAISALYASAVIKYASANPFHLMDWFEEDLHDFDYWSTDEIHQFLSWANGSLEPRYAFYLTAYETGLRASELIGLQRDCLDFSRGIITVRRTWCSKTWSLQSSTKSGRKRVVGMSVNLKFTLIRELEKHSSSFVFHGQDQKPMTYNLIRKKFLEHQKLAGVRKINFHDLRHTFASHYLMRGGTLPELKELLGHAEYSTTLRYAHLAAEHLVAKAGLVTFTPPVPNQVIPLRMESKTETPKHFPNIGSSQTHLIESIEEKAKKSGSA